MGFIKIGAELFEMKVYLTELGQLDYLAQKFKPISFSLADEDIDYMKDLKIIQNVTNISGNDKILSLSKNVGINNSIINNGSGITMHGDVIPRNKSKIKTAAPTTTSTTTVPVTTTSTTTVPVTTTSTTTVPVTTTSTTVPVTTTSTTVPVTTTSTTTVPVTTTSTTTVPVTTTSTTVPVTTTSTTTVPVTTTSPPPDPTTTTTVQNYGTITLTNSNGMYIADIIGVGFPVMSYISTNGSTSTFYSNTIGAQFISVRVRGAATTGLSMKIDLAVDGIPQDCKAIAGQNYYQLQIPNDIVAPSFLEITIGTGDCFNL